MGEYDPQKEYRFRYSFTPAQIKWDAFKESIEAHSDVISTMSPAKLYVGSYRGTLKLLDDKTIQVTIENRTTLNSLFYHIGSGLEKLIITTEEKFNHLLEPFFTPTEQRFIFTVPLNQKK
ncbi:MAG: hypothetical protein KatS3mg035_2149 [Bacteroidia bacterium]|nr:MAG: hypothetical protein KatS3mg035_2149 [Bacteroidia bacterium]